MKHLIATVLVAATIALTGCTQATPPAASAPAPTFTSGIPKPDANQEASLLSSLKDINPLLINDKTVDAARNTCHSIIGSTDDAGLLKATKSRFTARQMKSVSDEEAVKIIAVVKANGFCTT